MVSCSSASTCWRGATKKADEAMGHVYAHLHGIRLLVDAVPPAPGEARPAPIEGDSLSPVAPHRVVNIGQLGQSAAHGLRRSHRRLPGPQGRTTLHGMQPGDVPATWADAGLLQRVTGYSPRTDFKEGVSKFVAWYRAFYRA